MFRLKQITKEFDATGSLCSQINLFGFLDDEIFLTKSGDLGIILSVDGVDYECLDTNTIENLTARLTAAFRLFDENCRVYQYLFKRNREHIPSKTYDNPIVNAAILNRIHYLNAKADSLYSVDICFVILFEGFRHKASILTSFAALPSDPRKAIRELLARLSTRRQVVLIETDLERCRASLRAKVRNFCAQVQDFVGIRTLPKAQAFRVLKQILNFSRRKVENAQLKHDTFLDYYLCESHLECHRGFLRVDDFYVKVLTLKEPSAQSFPLIFKRLLEVEANYFICTEWRKQRPSKSRSLIHSRRRHFHNTKRSISSYVTTSDQPQRNEDILIDESKEAQVRDLGEALKEIEIKGNYFGNYSLTVVIYDEELAKVESASAEFYKAFSVQDAQVYEEKYNLFNAYLATVPGNYAFNLRSMLILNTNYADYSFLFTLHSGHKVNAHSVILGRTGAGKSFLLNFLITNLQKYDPYTFIFDLGGSFESLTRLFGGTYVRVGLNSPGFKINPFSVPPTKENLDFLALFLKVLIQGNTPLELTPSEERDLYRQIENLYEIEPALRTLTVLSNTLDRRLADRLSKWTTGGQFDFVFDNAEDTITFSRFQCFDFQGMNQ